MNNPQLNQPGPGAFLNFDKVVATKPGHGEQNHRIWRGTEADERSILSVEQPASLWKVTVFGDVYLTINWGDHGGGFTVRNVQSPMIGYFPGAIDIVARPRIAGGDRYAKVVCKPVDGPGVSVIRYLETAAVPLPPGAVRMRCLVAGSYQINSLPITAAPLGTVVECVNITNIVTGTWLVEIEP